VADNTSGNGLSYRASAGDLGVAASNTPALYANRMGSDGTIADFRKDGTSVGSIQARGGDLVIGTGDTGVRFNDASNALQPHHATDVTDNTIDIGLSSHRFKDLYLSGTAYADEVGIGTTAPTAKLHVDSGNSGVTPTSGTQLFLEGTANATLQLGTLYTGNSKINFGRGSTPGGGADVDVGRILYNAQLNYMSFSTNNQERFRVDSSGRMLIGTTSLGSYGAVLRAPNGAVESSRYIAATYGSLFKNSGYYGTAGITLHSYSAGTLGTQKMMSFQSSGTTEYGSITIAGSTTSYNTSSDERLKENIKDAEDAGDKIDAIKIRQFDWKEGGQHQDYGVIAQELDEVAPEAVTKGVTEDDMMSVDYSKLVPTLIKEIQSLRNRVTELEKN